MRVGREHTQCPVCGKFLVLNGSTFRRHVRADRRLPSGKGIRCPASNTALAAATGLAAAARRAATAKERAKVRISVVDLTPYQFDVEATVDGRQVGKVEAAKLIDGGTPWFVIGNCGVDAAMRRRGIGTAMVRIALDEGARRYAATKAYIDVVPHAGATSTEVHAFWNGLGFTLEVAEVAFGFRGTLMSKTQS